MVSLSDAIDRRKSLLGFAASVVAQTLTAVARDRVVAWQDTVQLEHSDRLNQLRQLSRDQLIAPPQLYTTLVGRQNLPAVFGTDIPVLRIVFDQRVFFDTDRDEIRPEAERAIDVVAETLLRGAADTAVFVAGHTDSRGSDTHNYYLSVRRAESVAIALSLRRVPQTNVWRIGFGEAVPLVPNTTDEGMARNRRVEFIIARKAEAAAKVLAGQRSLICAGASDAERVRCLETLGRTPPVAAAPVREGRVVPGFAAPDPATTAAVPRVESRSLVEPGKPETRIAVGPPGTTPRVVEIPAQERRVVTIAPDEPVVVDLNMDRVLIQRLER